MKSKANQKGQQGATPLEVVGAQKSIEKQPMVAFTR